QVFQNLMENAKRFIPSEGGSITISATRNDKMWQFCVADNGIGIDPSQHERIFQIFRRLESGTDKKHLGIGLSLVKKIIENYGGRIWVESQKQQGCRFFFTIPEGETNLS
ncbi:MAG: ATP-binding protein, partial [Deltaproteobacteria bacterium]|nr:ATP-binding protein [Deltaproteobacteria bacterium]